MLKFSEIKCKEVININDGNKLGFISDIEFNCKTGEICAIIVPCEGKFLGVFGKGDDCVIPYCKIEKIGDDVILVCCDD